MPIEIPQISFGGGVISPATFARIDLQKFGTAAKGLTNFFVHAEGGTSNRPGTEYVRAVKDSTHTVRLIQFEYNEEQAYALEFGNLYMRVIKDGGLVLEGNVVVSGASATNPVVITATAHGYANGDEVYLSSLGGMTEVNGKYFTVTSVTANTFALAGVNGLAYTAYTVGGTVARVFELATPYVHTDLARLKFRQSNDVVYLAHTSYAPRKLGRTGHAAWTLTEIGFEPNQPFPTGITVTPVTTGTKTYKYKVTAVAKETAEESLVGTAATAAISAATPTNPVVITATGHGYANGNEVHISGVVGMTELNGRRFTLTSVAVNTFALKGIDGTTYTAYVSGGSADRTHQVVTNGNATVDNTITWAVVAGADKYNVYKDDNGLYGFIGATEELTFNDKNIAADLSDTAPKWRQPFSQAGNYPGAVGLHEQRSAWGNSINSPLSVWMSQTSQYENMNVSIPSRETDAVTLRLVAGQGNEIRHFRSFVDQLFVFTSGAVWFLKPGGTVDAITPTSKQTGISDHLPTTDTPPLTIRENILMVSGKQNHGFEVHSIGYQVDTDGYSGSDMTVLARHLFERHTISEWAYGHSPYRLVMAVRDDGKLLVMTFLHEHQIYAWSVIETEGSFESICNIPEGPEDVFYVVVKRRINGVDVKYIERLHSRNFATIEDAFFVDCGLTLNNPIIISGAGLSASNQVVITATAHGLSDGDSVKIRDVVGMTEINKLSFTVTGATANTFELLGVDGALYGTYVSGGTARREFSIVYGLDHLEGESLIALVDGDLEAGLVVSNGAVTLAAPASIAHIGIPYKATFESLPLNSGPETLAKSKNIKEVTLRVKDTRGLNVGPDVDHLQEYPSRTTELWGDPAALVSDVIRLPIPGDWHRENGVVVQTEAGLPMTILSAIADTNVGG